MILILPGFEALLFGPPLHRPGWRVCNLLPLPPGGTAAVPTAAVVPPSHSQARPSPTLVELPAKEQAMMQKTAL